MRTGGGDDDAGDGGGDGGGDGEAPRRQSGGLTGLLIGSMSSVQTAFGTEVRAARPHAARVLSDDVLFRRADAPRRRGTLRRRDWLRAGLLGIPSFLVEAVTKDEGNVREGSDSVRDGCALSDHY